MSEFIRTNKMFLFSKLLSAITQPLFWLALCWTAALLMLSRWQRSAVGMLWLGLGVLGLLGFEAISWELNLFGDCRQTTACAFGPSPNTIARLQKPSSL